MVNIFRHSLRIALLVDSPMDEASCGNELAGSSALENVHSVSKAVETSGNFMLYTETSVEEKGEIEAMEGINATRADSMHFSANEGVPFNQHTRY
jgi:hypothetical protein